jgi:protein-S-isoprenylcysteine O-methyltransferase Ste14
MADSRLARLLCSPLANAISGGLLAALWVMFAFAHYRAFVQHAEPSMILLVVSETLTAGFYLVRRPPQSISVKPVDWLLALGGTFVPLMFRPADTLLFSQASYLMVVGVLIQILGLLSLNRSFALVAARRAIKTDYMYRWVRHPIYASYVITFTGYLLVNATAMNAIVYAVWLPCMIGRIFREEVHLSEDAGYRDYMQRVRHRLLPGVF